MTSEITFSFGQNWRDFVETVDDDTVRRATADIEKWLGQDVVRGKRILDIGCGSGLHSLVFHQMGARDLVSFDYDPKSVEATEVLRARSGNPDNWSVSRGSVLDEDFLNSLGQFEIVYSWGVLHHTGAMWNAIEAACGAVAPGGLLWISLYTKGDDYPRDLALKQRYNRAGKWGKRRMEWQWILMLMRRRAKGRQNPFTWNEKMGRGMDTYHDIVDWLGGLPYEVASTDETVAFCLKRKLQLIRLQAAGSGGCSIYLFHYIQI